MLTTTARGPLTVAVSLKAYLGHAQATAWCAAVAEHAAAHQAVADGRVRLAVLPTYLQVLPALAAFRGTPVLVGAQDVAATGPGPWTGEVTADELAEVGVEVVEVGHAERRRLFGETDEVAAAKAAAAVRAGLVPLVCVGETERTDDVEDAVAAAVAQLLASLRDVPAGPVAAAYEPVWAIGAPEPAPAEHVRTVTRALRAALDVPARAGSAVLYGGSAGPGLLTRLGDAVDGLFLGRFAHDPDVLPGILDEAAALADGAAPQVVTG